MPPRLSVQTRSKSIPKQPAPAVVPPPSALPSVIATTGYPDRAALSALAKPSKSPLSGLHFGRDPLAPSVVKGKAVAPRSPSPTCSASTISSTNPFSVLTNHGDTNTITTEELMTLDLLGLPDNSFDESTPSSSSTVASHSPAHAPPWHDQRRRPVRAPPPTPALELGCAQNVDGTLRDAADIEFVFDPDDDVLMPPVRGDAAATHASSPASHAVDTVTTAPDADSPFLTPVTATLPAAALTSAGSKLPPAPSLINIADAAAAAGRAHQAWSSAAHSPTSPVAPPSQPAPPVLPSPTPKPAPPSAQTPALSATPQPAPSPALLPAPAPTLFTAVVTRSQTKRATAGAPSNPPKGMFIPQPAASATAPQPAPQPLAAPQTAPQPLAALQTAPQPAPQPVQQPFAAPQPVPQPLAALQPVPQPLAAPQPAQPLFAAQPLAAHPLAPAAGGALPIASAAAAAAALGGAPLPVFCHIPLNVPGIFSPDRLTACDNISPTLLPKWDALPGGKFLIYEWNGRPHSIDSGSVKDLKAAITRLTGATPLVGPPVAANPGNRAAPFMYLVRGVSDVDTQRFLDGRIWNMVGGTTFFAIPYDAPSSDFLFTLDGFSFSADDGVEVADLVVSVIYNNPTAQTLLALNHDAYAAAADPMAHFAASLRVSPVSTRNANGRARIA
ncbi:hypothetical protein B0H17DRAFT_1204693 [Mycena rosella]|uniref:Uncharacterized protein n=1 Tax=Mycena rosella TaxID=1033263 RepID=A0AAD7GAZ3_MYCRO|nr:hypothetical protein B0H17DRAFT_1204693 [Mycena rosella]